jgi:hypothetical protein
LFGAPPPPSRAQSPANPARDINRRASNAKIKPGHNYQNVAFPVLGMFIPLPAPRSSQIVSL